MRPAGHGLDTPVLYINILVKEFKCAVLINPAREYNFSVMSGGKAFKGWIFFLFWCSLDSQADKHTKGGNRQGGYTFAIRLDISVAKYTSPMERARPCTLY